MNVSSVRLEDRLAGVSGYLLKGAPAERLAEAIRRVHGVEWPLTAAGPSLTVVGFNLSGARFSLTLVEWNLTLVSSKLTVVRFNLSMVRFNLAPVEWNLAPVSSGLTVGSGALLCGRPLTRPCS